MAAQQLSDQQVFGTGYAYGPGAAESGQPATQAQADYARAAATSRDQGAPVGTPQNPSYDTASARGNDTIYHVGPDGRLYDPVASAQPSGVAPKPMSDDEVFNFTPGQTFDSRPTSQPLGAAEGANTVFKNFSDILTARLPGAPASPAAGMLFPAQLASSVVERIIRSKLDSAEKTARPGDEAKVGTELGLTLPLAFTGEGAPAIMGALQGDLSSDATDPLGRARDIGIGAVGGKVGSLVGSAAKSVIWPTIRPEAQWALDNNIRLTPGGIAGGMAKGLETGASKGTIAGPMIGAAQQRGIDDFNTATARQVLDGTGIALPDGVGAGHELVNTTHNLLSGAFNALAPQLSLARDAPLAAAASEATNAGTLLPAAYRARMDALVSQLPAAGGAINGRTVQDLTAQLRQESADALQSGDFFAKDYGRAIDKLRSAVDDGLERGNPQQASQLQALRTAWAKQVRVERAARDAVQDGGVFTPKGLLTAVRATDQSARDNATARGEALLQDWANNGKAVLPDKLPATGSVFAHLPELAVTLGVGKEAGLPGVAGLLGTEGLAGLLYTKPAQAALSAAMTQRPAVAQPISDIVRRLSPFMGQGGAVIAKNAVWPRLQAYAGNGP